MEPTLQGFLDFHGETIKKQYDMYIESIKPRKDDIESITESMEKVEIIEKPKNKGRKCGLCQQYGHNRRTCPTIKNDKPQKSLKKKKIDKVVFNYDNFIKEVYDLNSGECICDLCHTDFTNNMLTNHNDKKICSNCYKITVIDGITDFDLCTNKECKCIECQTIPLSPKESQSMNDLLSDDTNDYIIYEGVEYTFDDTTNIISYDYEELGIWNTDSQSINWFNSECESIHINNKSF